MMTSRTSQLNSYLLLRRRPMFLVDMIRVHLSTRIPLRGAAFEACSVNMSKAYRTQLEVRGYELDSFGHVNHANYLNYFEHARWRMLQDEGITLEVLEKWKRWPVIAAIEVKYLKPTFMG